MFVLKLIVLSIIFFNSNAQRYYYYGKFNNELVLNEESPAQEKLLSWSLNNRITGNKLLYFINQPTKSIDYLCLPSNASCSSLKINKLRKEVLGEYRRKVELPDRKTVETTHYVFGYDPIKVSCKSSSNQDLCSYNSETSTLTVQENVQASVTCSATIYEEDSIKGQSVATVTHAFNDEDCLSTNTNNPSNSVAKACLRTFKRTDSVYSCNLGANSKDIDRIDFKLNVRYPLTLNQEQLNSIQAKITYPQGNAQKLKCPYDGNPIAYIWRSIDNNIEKVVGTDKVYVVPSTYAAGVYIFECQALIPGDLKSKTNPQRFILEITKPIQSKQFYTKSSKIQHFGKMNSALELKPPTFEFAEKDISWILDNNKKVSKLYEANKLERPYDYTCSPSVNSCLSLKINSLTKTTLGDYLRKGVSVDDRTTTQTDFFVYGYSPIDVLCAPEKESDNCIYDGKTQTITIKENVPAIITCNSALYKAGDFTPNVVIESRFRGKDNNCLSEGRSNLNNREGQDYENSISESCFTKFNRTHKTYTCILKSINDTEEIIIEKFDINLNIQYPPTKNQTELQSILQKVSIPHGTRKELSCPYEGNPIAYIWRHLENNQPLSTNKTFTVPAHYAPGVHDLECLAYVPGDLKSFTEPQKFLITITESKVPFHKKYKNYLIAAAIISGVLLLGIITGAIFIAVRKVLGNKSGNKRSKTSARGAPHENVPLKA